MASSADALQVVPNVGIAQLQPLDQPRRHDVIYMATTPGLFEIGSTRFDLAVGAKSWHPLPSPILTGRRAPGPFPLTLTPTQRSFLRAIALLAAATFSLAVRIS